MEFIVTEKHRVTVPRADEAIAILEAKQAKWKGTLEEYIWANRNRFKESIEENIGVEILCDAQRLEDAATQRWEKWWRNET
jgi:hypothetical protein